MTRVELKSLVSKKADSKSDLFKSIFSYADNFGCMTHAL